MSEFYNFIKLNNSRSFILNDDPKGSEYDY